MSLTEVHSFLVYAPVGPRRAGLYFVTRYSYILHSLHIMPQIRSELSNGKAKVVRDFNMFFEDEG